MVRGKKKETQKLIMNVPELYISRCYLQCKICNYSCSKKRYLKRHLELVHRKKKLFKCDSTEKSIVNKHLESVHEEKKQFKCDSCEYSCSQKGHLKRHLESVHEKKNIQM